MFCNEQCTQAVKNRNKARNHMLATKDLDDCMKYRRLKGVAQRVIKSSKKQSWESYCGTLNDRTRMCSVWKTAKSMSGRVKDSPISNLKHGQVNYVTNPAKADLLSDVLSGVSSISNYTPSFQIHIQHFETIHNTFLHEESEEYIETNPTI